MDTRTNKSWRRSMLGGCERLSCYKQTKSFKALQAQRLGGFFYFIQAQKTVDNQGRHIYNSRAKQGTNKKF